MLPGWRFLVHLTKGNSPQIAIDLLLAEVPGIGRVKYQVLVHRFGFFKTLLNERKVRNREPVFLVYI
jgi:hypothetical protein